MEEINALVQEANMLMGKMNPEARARFEEILTILGSHGRWLERVGNRYELICLRQAREYNRRPSSSFVLE